MDIIKRKSIYVGFFEIKNKINLKKITKINCYIVRDCLQKLTDFKILIKKPNDLLIKKQKICGILQETIFKNEKKFLVVGIGLNLNKSPKIKNYQTNFINFLRKKMLQDYKYLNYCVIPMKKKLIYSNSFYIVGDIGNTDTKIF